MLQRSRRSQRTLGSSICQAVYEGTCKADLGRACAVEEEEADMAEEG